METKTLRAPGDLVETACETLRQQLLAIVTSGCGLLRLDLSETQVCDAIGLRLLLAARNSLTKTGGRLRLEHVRQDLAELLVALGLRELLEEARGHMDCGTAESDS